MKQNLIAVTSGVFFALVPIAGHAATVDGGSFGLPATGELAYSSTFNSVSTQIFDVQSAGTLDSYTMWINTTSNFLTAGEDLVYVLLGKNAGPSIPSVSDELARINISSADLLGGPTITGGDGDSYVAAIWDMSSLGISTLFGEQFGVRLFPDGSSGQVKYNGTSCNSGPGTLACDFSLGLKRFQGTQADVGNSGSSVFVGTYALTVDDGIVPPNPSVVPLPAGLPLLLAGLGAFGILRRAR